MPHLRIRFAFLVLAALALCGAASSQEQVSTALSVEVSAVVSGGRWQSGSLQGVYRVVVRTGGFEHVISQAQVDWIADPAPGSSEARLVTSKLVPTGSWRLDSPRIIKSGKGWRVDFEAIETHFNPPKRGKWVVSVGGPGELWAKLADR